MIEEALERDEVSREFKLAEETLVEFIYEFRSGVTQQMGRLQTQVDGIASETQSNSRQLEKIESGSRTNKHRVQWLMQSSQVAVTLPFPCPSRPAQRKSSGLFGVLFRADTLFLRLYTPNTTHFGANILW
jgi:hypothetical protein